MPLTSTHHSLFSSPLHHSLLSSSLNICEQNDLNAKYCIPISYIEVASPALSKKKDKEGGDGVEINSERDEGNVRQRGDVLVAMGIDHPKLYHTHLKVRADRMSWVAGQPPLRILDQLAALREKSRRNRERAYGSNSPSSSSFNNSSSSSSSSSSRSRSCSDSSSVECYDEDGASGGTGDGVLVKGGGNDAVGTNAEVEAFVCEFRARYQQKMGVCSITARLVPADPDSSSACHLKNDITSTLTSKQQELLTGASVESEFPSELEEVLEDYVLDVVFHEARRAVTPGQVLALYMGGECLGGGVIS